MIKCKIKKNDDVIVIAGKDKGRRGVVLRVLANQRVLVEGVNIIHKHVKPNPEKNIQGGIVQKEASLHISNIALYNPLTKKADRVGVKILAGDKAEKPKKVRYFKSNKEVVDV